MWFDLSNVWVKRLFTNTVYCSKTKAKDLEEKFDEAFLLAGGEKTWPCAFNFIRAISMIN